MSAQWQKTYRDSMGKLMKVQSADNVRVKKNAHKNIFALLQNMNCCVFNSLEIRNMDKKFCFPEFQTLYQIVL